MLRLALLPWLLGLALAQEPLPKNCFSFVDESRWELVLGFNQSAASLHVRVAGAGSSVLTCLGREPGAVYQVAVVGDLQSSRFLAEDHLWQGRAKQLLAHPPTFPYLIYPGRYRLKLTYCGPATCAEPALHETVFSDFLNIQSSVRLGCEVSSANRTGLRERQPEVEQMTALFHFTFPACSLHSYDTANLSLYSAQAKADCGTQLIFQETVPVTASPVPGEVAILYRSPELRGDRYYCVSLTLSHISCRLAGLRSDELCHLPASEPVWVPSVPAIAALLPFCSSHFACAWLYVTVAGCLLLAVSLVLALVLVRCCRRWGGGGREGKGQGDEVDFGGGELQEVPQERVSWGSLHKEWESGEEKPRGKILLLYSPDTKLFRELQEALKSFLDLACHCDIYDLFDDALFDTIALDPR
jgi:hypothetical protein